MNRRCFFGLHRYRFRQTLTDLTNLHRCDRCGAKALFTIAAGPELIVPFNSPLGRKYQGWLKARGVRL